ncbi:MAG: outer membrane protein assembly factor BamA [Candidatus Dependentiae bacterium]
MKRLALAFIFLCATSSLLADASTDPVIQHIAITGNTHISTEAIKQCLPYQEGGRFDAKKSCTAINKMYALGGFRQVVIEKENGEDDTVDLFITVTEKPRLTGITYEGNSGLTIHKLDETIGSATLHTIDESHAHLLAKRLKKEYRENDYHHAVITPELRYDQDNADRATLHFVIDEKQKSKIRTIRFVGNETVPGRALRGHMISSENWLMGFLSGAGTYNPDMVEADKQYLAMYYYDRGHLTAQVTDAKATFHEDGNIDLIYTINEGPVYTIKEIGIADDPDVPQFILRRFLLQQPGDIYKASALRETIKGLEAFYGQQGYIDAHISPSIIPDPNTHFVNIHFTVDKGVRWRLNQINITGNNVTRDHVIRRQIELEEGGVITTQGMERSKQNVEYLSYFEREGIEWKKHRIGPDLIDLELRVKEAHTREVSGGIDFGPGKGSTEEGLKLFASAKLNNVGGLGWDSSFIIRATRKHLSQFSFNVVQPYLFGSNIGGTFDISYNKMVYENWHWVSPEPYEDVFGTTSALHIPLPSIDRRLSLRVEGGFELTSNNNKKIITKDSNGNITSEVNNLQINSNVYAGDHERMRNLLEQKLQSGALKWLAADLIKDTRNHRIYPNDGYRLALRTKLAPPLINSKFRYLKTSLEASWYTPLIGTDELVLGLHSKFGYAESFGSGMIPYRELSHLGGADSIRGFNWSQVSPSWDYQNPLGGKKSVQFNAELIFPLLHNYNMKMHFFYDAGCAWDTPKDPINNKTIHDNLRHVRNDTFNLRHTVGVGLNILRPQPMKLSFGYKLDRNKKIGETAHEFHIGMNAAF